MGFQRLSTCALMIVFSLFLAGSLLAATEGQYSYDDFASPDECADCHTTIYSQWQESMMAQSYVHDWDEIEYFKLALPHALKEEKVAEVKAGCNGCHAPLAFLAGDIPPQPPEAGTRANEGVACDVCHSITGYDGELPFNFNFTMSPGEAEYGPRGNIEEAGHEVVKSEFIRSTEFCGTCHNEKSPFGAWVKATQIEWADGPYATKGTRCQDCHMTYTKAATAVDGTVYDDAAQHMFHGAHNQGKINGVVELEIYAEEKELNAGDEAVFSILLYNQKTGHSFPTGSVEDRILWLHVEATDASGKVYHLPVDKKGFEGEQFTIGADVLAYQDMSVPLEDPDFKGLQRDGIPVGDRIFRMPYLDPEGRMTIQQWNTASFGPDYRFGPMETKKETFTFSLPEGIAKGDLTISAQLNYQKLVKPVADFFGIPHEADIMPVNSDKLTVTVM